MIFTSTNSSSEAIASIPFYHLTSSGSQQYSTPPAGMVYVPSTASEPPPVYAAAVADKNVMYSNEVGSLPSSSSVDEAFGIDDDVNCRPLDFSTPNVMHSDGSIAVPPNSVLPQSVVPVIPSTVIPPASVQQKVYPCVSCKKTFNQRSYVRRHMKVHGPTPFICQVCPNSMVRFSTESELKEHIRVHSGELEYNWLMNQHFPVDYITPESLKPELQPATSTSILINKSNPVAGDKRERHFTSEGVREMAALQAHILDMFCDGQAPPMTSVSDTSDDNTALLEKRNKCNNGKSDMLENDPAKTLKTLITTNITPQQYTANGKQQADGSPQTQLIQHPDGQIQYVQYAQSVANVDLNLLSPNSAAGQQLVVQYINPENSAASSQRLSCVTDQKLTNDTLDLGPDVELAEGEPSTIQYITTRTSGSTVPSQTTLPSYGIAMGTYLETGEVPMHKSLPKVVQESVNGTITGNANEWSQFEAAQSLIGLHGNSIAVGQAAACNAELSSVLSSALYQNAVSSQSPLALTSQDHQSPVVEKLPVPLTTSADHQMEIPRDVVIQSAYEHALNQVGQVNGGTLGKGSKPFFCSICERKFSQKTNISRHMMLHTGVRPYQCSTCQRGFIQSQSLRQHRLRHHPDEPIGSISPISRSTTGKHNLTYQIENELPSAGAGVPGLEMELHVELHGVAPESSVDETIQPTPASVATPKEDNKVLPSNPESPGTNVKVTKVFSCPVCGRTFTRKMNMHAHLLKHTDSKPYKCNICEASFSQTIALKNHMMKIHQAIVNYRQITEQMVVSNKADIVSEIVPNGKESVSMMPVPGEPNPSSDIEMEIVQPMGTVPLYAQHTVETSTYTDSETGQEMKVQLYKCALCNILFTKQEDLEEHFRTHVTLASSVDGSNHVCDTCSKAFSSSEDLEAHRKVHMWDDLMDGGSNSDPMTSVESAGGLPVHKGEFCGCCRFICVSRTQLQNMFYILFFPQ